MTSKPYIDPKHVDKPSRKAVLNQFNKEKEADINNMTTPQILWFVVKRERFTLALAYAVAMSVAFVVVV